LLVLLSFEICLQPVELDLPERLVALEPFARTLERALPEPATHHAPGLVPLDEPRAFQDAQVLDETGEGHAERLCKLSHGVFSAFESREHGASRGVGERTEYGIEAGGLIVNHLVHCMPSHRRCQWACLAAFARQGPGVDNRCAVAAPSAGGD
jgi:hypothetical protein